ncbi:MAG: hypothetical protein KKF68_02250 [Nanoarchaeota archaeon]|nr:hypothetical protein [Nanoarchaeota archaeon]
MNYFDFNFRPFYLRDLDRVGKFLLNQPLDYPHYSDWVLKTLGELEEGYKQAVLALSDSVLVGNVIYQPHKTLPGFCELKNARVHLSLQRRFFLGFMIKQIEIFSQEKGDRAVICDVRSSRKELISLLSHLGFIPLVKVPLYDEVKEDLVLVKPLRAFDEQNFLSRVRGKILESAF